MSVAVTVGWLVESSGAKIVASLVFSVDGSLNISFPVPVDW